MSLDSAVSHTLAEISLESIKKSLSMMYRKAAKSHNAIHQFILVAPKLFPSPPLPRKGKEWHKNSAFLTYHWEAFHSAHRSFHEAVLGGYNAAFILLRATLELLIRGAFFECLAHKKFRDTSKWLDKEFHAAKLKRFIEDVIKLRPSIEQDLETISVAIYDKLEPVIDEPEFRVPVKTMVMQLEKWGILRGVKNPSQTIWDLYQILSKDVHVLPDRTDIGKALLYAPKDLFKTPKLLRKQLAEYLHALKEVMDIGIIVELNILRDNLVKYEQAKDYVGRLLRDREFRYLELKHTPKLIQMVTATHD